MKISEFIDECQEYLTNIQWKASNFYCRTTPENTRPELGRGQNMVYQQGVPCLLTNEEVVKSVLLWTDWDSESSITVKELCDAFMGRVVDREIPISWL